MVCLVLWKALQTFIICAGKNSKRLLKKVRDGLFETGQGKTVAITFFLIILNVFTYNVVARDDEPSDITARQLRIPATR